MTLSPTIPTMRDTSAIEEFMLAFGQTVRTEPTTDIPDQERLLRARLVVEEALEFAAAMGCTVRVEGGTVTTPKDAVVDIDPEAQIDLVEAADAISDLVVVAKGSALTLGVPTDEVFEAVHASNMAKLGPDGRPVFKPGPERKVGKPEGWEPPTARIEAILGV